MKKIMTLVVALFFTVALSAENQGFEKPFADIGYLPTITIIPQSDFMGTCTVFVGIDCGSDGTIDFDAIVDCTNVQAYIDATTPLCFSY